MARSSESRARFDNAMAAAREIPARSGGTQRRRHPVLVKSVQSAQAERHSNARFDRLVAAFTWVVAPLAMLCVIGLYGIFLGSIIWIIYNALTN